MAVLRRCMVVFKARCGCLLGRSQSGLVKSSNASSLVAMVGIPVGRSRMKIAAPLPSFGSGRSGVPLRDDSLSSTPFERTTSPPPAVEEGPKLYVGNLPWPCDSQQLAEIFQDCGAVEHVEMLGGRSLTVSFPQSNQADRSHPLPQREFGINGGGGSGSYDSENRLFVGNLSWGVDASLQTMFSDYGKVMDARVVYDRETGRSHGFGFVTLSTAAEVNDAIQNLDGAFIIFGSGPDGGISPL
ncbi:unnamed protein product [Sphagnum troendelagicum]|uniref:RRM domain-containing protein n=1 Tax=Sphagnum troendelagicum TaxID=128251 RepID=A0ABP0TLC6_9BRYO